MSSSAPAGWYPDPLAAGVELWWDGAAWTASCRPAVVLPGVPVLSGLLTAPALVAGPATPAVLTMPAVPVPVVALPPAGWYLSPHNATEETWFDGAGWTEMTRPRQQPDVLAGVLGSLGTGLQQGARNPRAFYGKHQQGVEGTAGGALLVDGLVGLPTPGGNRGGIFKAHPGWLSA